MLLGVCTARGCKRDVIRIREKTATALHGNLKDRFDQFAVMLPRPNRIEIHVHVVDMSQEVLVLCMPARSPPQPMVRNDEVA
jgi:hypothetical protein